MRNRRARSVYAAALLPVLLSGCEALKLSVMNHAGPVAAEQWRLYVIVGAVLVFVAGPVLVLTPIIAWHYRLSNRNSTFKPKWSFSWPLEGLIWIPPAGIVVGLGFLLWSSTHRLDPYRPLVSSQPALQVQAIGLDWKWLFIYPGQGVAAVNRLVIPVGRPVHIRLTSGTVMQSMLIPQLAGQIYAMAGMTAQLNLAASRPGVYRGENTQYNGDGFPTDKFDVVAVPPADYDRWMANVKASGRPLDAAASTELFHRASAPQPLFFSSVPNHFFQQILARAQEPTR